MRTVYHTTVDHVVVSPFDKQVECFFLIKREEGRKEGGGGGGRGGRGVEGDEEGDSRMLSSCLCFSRMGKCTGSIGIP